jgi:REP element-mobilizing transposase RayT
MTQPSYEMDALRRQTVLAALREVCAYRHWHLWAAHVRARHVHLVVSADAAPEKVMNDFKTYASRALNRASLDEPTRKRWTRHGSTRYINDERYLVAAINYVINRQGEKMETYEAPDAPRPSDEPPDEPRPLGLKFSHISVTPTATAPSIMDWRCIQPRHKISQPGRWSCFRF